MDGYHAYYSMKQQVLIVDNAVTPVLWRLYRKVTSTPRSVLRMNEPEGSLERGFRLLERQSRRIHFRLELRFARLVGPPGMQIV